MAIGQMVNGNWPNGKWQVAIGQMSIGQMVNGNWPNGKWQLAKF
jgi:hypothetical protein